MRIRTYQPGDEAAQVSIYNAAAAHLSRFKPATVQDAQKRVRDREFDPESRFYAEDGGQLVGYAAFNANGRISYPWCLPGAEKHAESLFDAMIRTMRARSYKKAFAAYRGDWPTVQSFFLAHGFAKAREMVNFVVDLVEMPTPSVKAGGAFTPVERKDIPTILALAPELFRVATVAEMDKHLFHNPYFTPDSLFAVRSRQDNQVVAVAILVHEPTYADPHAVDSAMPCFRLGAFGTERMQAKRIKGLFSFVARPDKSFSALALDLMGHALYRLQDHDDVFALAAQVPSDAPAFLEFYQRHFRKQAAFPVFEKNINR